MCLLSVEGLPRPLRQRLPSHRLLLWSGAAAAPASAPAVGCVAAGPSLVPLFAFPPLARTLAIQLRPLFAADPHGGQLLSTSTLGRLHGRLKAFPASVVLSAAAACCRHAGLAALAAVGRVVPCAA